MKLTNFDIQKEWKVVYETRLGALCGTDQPTMQQLEIAHDEADKWKARYLQEQSGELLL